MIKGKIVFLFYLFNHIHSQSHSFFKVYSSISPIYTPESWSNWSEYDENSKKRVIIFPQKFSSPHYRQFQYLVSWFWLVAKRDENSMHFLVFFFHWLHLCHTNYVFFFFAFQCDERLQHLLSENKRRLLSEKWWMIEPESYYNRVESVTFIMICSWPLRIVSYHQGCYTQLF